jgi:hypothetical protein
MKEHCLTIGEPTELLILLRKEQKQEGPFLGRAWLILLLEGLAFVGRIELAELILCQVLWKK